MDREDIAFRSGGLVFAALARLREDLGEEHTYARRTSPTPIRSRSCWPSSRVAIMGPSTPSVSRCEVDDVSGASPAFTLGCLCAA